MIFHYIKCFNDFFIVFSITFLLHDFFDRRFPNEYKIFTNYATKLFVNISYNCIYFYSKCQICFIQYVATNPVYVKIIDSVNSKLGKTNNGGLEFLFVKDNFHYKVPIDLPDLIITTNSSMKPALKKITYKGDYKDVDFQESDIKFILIEFKVERKSIKLI